MNDDTFVREVGLRPARVGTPGYLGEMGPTIYELKCDACGAVIAALDMSPNNPVPVRDALEERLLAEHECDVG